MNKFKSAKIILLVLVFGLSLSMTSTLFAQAPNCSDTNAATVISDLISRTKNPQRHMARVLRKLGTYPDLAALELSTEIQNLLSIAATPDFTRNNYNFADTNKFKGRTKAEFCLRMARFIFNNEKKPSQDLFKMINAILDSMGKKTYTRSNLENQTDLAVSLVKISDLWKNTKNIDTGISTVQIKISNNGPNNISSFNLNFRSSKYLKYIKEASDLVCDLSKDGSYNCNVEGLLASGKSIEKTFKFSLESEAVCDSTQQIIFSISSSLNDPNLFNNTRYVNTKVLCTTNCAALATAKSQIAAWGSVGNFRKNRNHSLYAYTALKGGVSQYLNIVDARDCKVTEVLKPEQIDQYESIWEVSFGKDGDNYYMAIAIRPWWMADGSPENMRGYVMIYDLKKKTLTKVIDRAPGGGTADMAIIYPNAKGVLFAASYLNVNNQNKDLSRELFTWDAQNGIRQLTHFDNPGEDQYTNVRGWLPVRSTSDCATGYLDYHPTGLHRFDENNTPITAKAGSLRTQWPIRYYLLNYLKGEFYEIAGNGISGSSAEAIQSFIALKKEYCKPYYENQDPPLPSPSPSPSPEASKKPSPEPSKVPSPDPSKKPSPSPSPVNDPADDQPSGTCLAASKCTLENNIFKSSTAGCKYSGPLSLEFSNPGNSIYVNSLKTWAQADKYCRSLNEGLANNNTCAIDWRLPTEGELKVILATATLRYHVKNVSGTIWTASSKSPGTHLMFNWASNQVESGLYGDSSLAGVTCVRGATVISDTPVCNPLTVSCTKNSDCCSRSCKDQLCDLPAPHSMTRYKAGEFCIDDFDCGPYLYCNGSYACQAQNASTVNGWKLQMTLDAEYDAAVKKIAKVSGPDRLVIHGGGRVDRYGNYNNTMLKTSYAGVHWDIEGYLPNGLKDSTIVNFQGKPSFYGDAAMTYRSKAETFNSGFETLSTTIGGKSPAIVSFNGELIQVGIEQSRGGPGVGTEGTRYVRISTDGKTSTFAKNKAGSQEVLPFVLDARAKIATFIDPKTFRQKLITFSSNDGYGFIQVATSEDGRNWNLVSKFQGFTEYSEILVINNKIVITDGYIIDLRYKDSRGRPMPFYKLFVSTDGGLNWQVKQAIPKINNLVGSYSVAHHNGHLWAVARATTANASGSNLFVYPNSAIADVAIPVPSPKPSVKPTASPVNVECTSPYEYANKCKAVGNNFSNGQLGCQQGNNLVWSAEYWGNPSNGLTYSQAQNYCAKLNQVKCGIWKLPTQAQFANLNSLAVDSNLGFTKYINFWAAPEKNNSLNSYHVGDRRGTIFSEASRLQVVCVSEIAGNNLTSETTPKPTPTPTPKPSLKPSPTPTPQNICQPSQTVAKCKAQTNGFSNATQGCMQGTNLVWSSQHPKNSSGGIKYKEAQKYCGCDGWRLPNQKELAGIKDFAGTNLGLNIYGHFWADPNDPSGNNSYSLAEKKGTLFWEETDFSVICVRSQS